MLAMDLNRYVVCIVFLLCGIVLQAKETINVAQGKISISISKVSSISVEYIRNSSSSVSNLQAITTIRKTLALSHDAKPTIKTAFSQWKELPVTINQKLLQLTHNNGVQEYINLKKNSTIRDIQTWLLSINPLRYDSTNKIYMIADSIAITIESPTLITDFSYSIPRKEQGLLAHIINPSHIPSARIHSKLSENILANSWYDPQQEYLQLTTKNDGIAYVKATDILALKPTWKDIPLGQLTLFFKGAVYPLGIKDNGNGMFDETDAMFFAGSRAQGDTTWKDYVTDEANFFLTRNLIPNPDIRARLSLLDTSKSTTIDSSITLSIHKEQDTELYAGDVIDGNDFRYLTSDFSTGKNFFWKKLSTIDKYRVFSDTIALPKAQSDVNVSIALHGASERPKLNKEHNFSVYWNDSLIQTESFAGFENYKSVFKIARDKVRDGNNIITIISNPVSDSIVTEFYIDYITINGQFNADFKNTPFHFSAAKNSATTIPIFNLKSAPYIIIDTLHNQYAKQNKGAQPFIQNSL